MRATLICTLKWALSWVLLSTPQVLGLVNPQQSLQQRRRTFALFVQQQPPDRILRDEIAERNSAISNEEQYAVADGSGLEQLNKPMPPSTPPPVDLQQQLKAASELEMDRMARPRPYPLFLLEKGLEVAESALDDLGRTVGNLGIGFGETGDDLVIGQPPLKKERLVVLGTGWGGVSLLKEIDTSLYDITIISPRNHFVFTPMVSLT